MLIEKINSVLIKHKEIGAVYLFGSYAKGNAHTHSDIDLLFFFNTGMRYHRDKRGNSAKCMWWKGHKELQFFLEKPIDIFDGDFFLYRHNHLTGDIFSFLEYSKLIYQKKSYILPDLEYLKTDYIRYKKALRT